MVNEGNVFFFVWEVNRASVMLKSIHMLIRRLLAFPNPSQTIKHDRKIQHTFEYQFSLFSYRIPKNAIASQILVMHIFRCAVSGLVVFALVFKIRTSSPSPLGNRSPPALTHLKFLFQRLASKAWSWNGELGAVGSTVVRRLVWTL